MPAASSIYWNSEDSQRSSGDGSEPTSASSTSGGRRRYIDPWDLENYAYLRRQQNLISTSRNDDAAGLLTRNISPQLANNESRSSDSHYWYPMSTAMTEPGYEAAASIEQLYLGPSQAIYQGHQYPVQQATYEDDTRYVTPNPVYVPLSDLECSEEAADQPSALWPKLQPRRRHKSLKHMAYPKDECPCPYHGPLADAAVGKEAGGPPPKQLGLNTYGHLRIDYAKSWNSLHRKMKK